MKAIGVMILLLAACGRDEGESGGPAAESNQIERLSTPADGEVEDRQATARLQPLASEDIVEEGISAPRCEFRSAGELLLVASDGGALARHGGNLVHLVHSSPTGPSGGFFEDRSLSISVGRTGEAGTSASEVALGWPARAAITNRRTRAQVELTGMWSCVDR